MGDISEGMLSAALYHMETGSCPTVKATKVVNQAGISQQNTGPALHKPDKRFEQMIENNAIITPIKDASNQ